MFWVRQTGGRWSKLKLDEYSRKWKRLFTGAFVSFMVNTHMRGGRMGEKEISDGGRGVRVG